MHWTRAAMMFMALPLFALSYPSTGNNGGDDRERLLEIHRQNLKAHLASDPEPLVSGAADRFFSVRDGKVTWPSREERERRFREYLGSTSFRVYEDIQPPIIKIANDGSMAWSVVQVKAAGTQAGTDKVERPLDFVSAWIMVYEKREGRWVATGVVSTFKPEGEQP